MSNSKHKHLSKFAKSFLAPKNPAHRQYEALRAVFVEGKAPIEVARTFGYTPGSFNVLCHEFRQNPDREFFLPTTRGPRAAPKRDATKEQMIALRKKNLSVYDISEALRESGIQVSAAHVANVLRAEGFERLPRRSDEERVRTVAPDVAAVSDCRELDLGPRKLHTRLGGLFLFLPLLAQIPLERILADCKFPGTAAIPAAHAMRALLALKLFGSARHSHVMSQVFDEGVALFAGLNVVPKKAFLTQYSCRIAPASYEKLMRLWFNAMVDIGGTSGNSFDLDFHAIPFHGEDALVEKHYVSKRSRSQKAVLSFLALDAEKNKFCYANGQVRKKDQDDEILRFVDFWTEKSGKKPQELVFDSKLTTHANLSELNQNDIQFITLRRRSQKLIESIDEMPVSAWRRIKLDSVGRIYKTPMIIDQKIELTGYEGKLRQIVVKELGHEDPTLLLTNQLKRSAATLVGRYARRMLIENAIADGIDFFHMDALSSAVPMKVNCDLQLTLMASTLYRFFGEQIGNGYATAKSRHIFQDLIEASADIIITEDDEIIVKFQKRAHNPLLLAAGFGKIDVRIPWLKNRRLRFDFGHQAYPIPPKAENTSMSKRQGSSSSAIK
jgi:hypothetical protein